MAEFLRERPFDAKPPAGEVRTRAMGSQADEAAAAAGTALTLPLSEKKAVEPAEFGDYLHSCQPLKHALKSIRCFCRRCHFCSDRGHFCPRFVLQMTFVASSDCTKLCAAFMARFSSGSMLLATSG